MDIKIKKYQNFPVVRLGNKYREIKNFIQHIPENINRLIEGFAGSFSLIRLLSDEPNKRFKKAVICEKDKDFLDCLDYIFNNLNDFKEYHYKIKDMIKDIFNKEISKDERYKRRKELLNNFQNPHIKYFIDKSIKSAQFLKIPRDTEKIFKSYENIKELYKTLKIYNDFNDLKKLKLTNKDFIFLDPPYFSSNNKQYIDNEKQKKGALIVDGTKMYIDILNFMKETKAKVMLIINKNYLIDYIFKDFYKDEYFKTYPISKKKEVLGVYCNY